MHPDEDRYCVSTKPVYSIRISPECRKIMEEMPDYNWQEELRTVVEETIRRRRREHLMARAKVLRDGQPRGSTAAVLIREDRDAR